MTTDYLPSIGLALNFIFIISKFAKLAAEKLAAAQ